jgi:hypothetical protein
MDRGTLIILGLAVIWYLGRASIRGLGRYVAHVERNGGPVR